MTTAATVTEYTIPEAKTLIQAFLYDNLPVMLWGPPGVGKSELAFQIAEEEELFFAEFRANLRESIDLRGLPMIDAKKGITKFLRPNDLPFIGNDGPDNCLLFLDEINTANQSMMAALFGLVLDRRIGEHVLKPGVRILAAGNRIADKAAANRMPTALGNRFAHFTIKADAAATRLYAARNGWHEYVQAFLAFRPGMVHVMPKGEEMAFPTPRTWERVSKMLLSNRLPQSQWFNMVAAIIGQATAGEFIAFIASYDELKGLFDEILHSPSVAKVPTNPAVKWALATSISRNATRENIGPLFEYAPRLGGEFDVLIGQETTARDPKLAETSAFVKWVQRNPNVHGSN